MSGPAGPEPGAPTRVPCPHCGSAVIVGARKCRSCRQWIGEGPRPRQRPLAQRAFALLAAAVVAVLAVIVSQRRSPVEEAPPLTPLTPGSAVVAAQVPGGGAARSGTARPVTSVWAGDPPRTSADAADEDRPRQWRSHSLAVDRHPLDVAFSPSGDSIYVSGDDATLWEYDLKTGKVLHMANLPAQGDRIRLLANRYLAIIRPIDAGHIPILDTQHWDRDPVLVYVGANPADIVELPGGKGAVAASSRGKRLTWLDLESGRRIADVQLPHVTQHLLLLRSGGRSYVGAMGKLFRAGEPEGAWLELFDPSEPPFGATRRSIPVGRDPMPGATTSDGSALFFADRAANNATLLRVDENTTSQSVAVGQSPEAAFIIGEDRYGVTVNSRARSASVVDLLQMKLVATLMLPGAPADGAATFDRSAVIVSLGGPSWPPADSGAAVIEGDPPRVVATFDTERGAARVTTAAHRLRAAVASFWGKTVTIIER